MSKKKLKVTAIQNELSEAAYFARQAPAAKPTAKPKRSARHTQETINKNEQTNVRTTQRTKERTDTPRKKVKRQRRKIRHSFDIYQDQLVSLQVLQLEAFKQGRKKPRLGDMVQKALDLYIRKKGT